MNTNTLTQVHTIVTHKRPHIDEVVAIVLLKMYGREKFPGIQNAKIDFWDAGIQSVASKNWKQHHKEGVLLIGLGASCFDEHPNESIDRKKEECAATLVANYLGIRQKPELEQLLRYTLNNDTKGGNNPFDLAAVFNLGNKTWFDKDPQAIFEWMAQPIEWWIAKQKRFFIETKAEFDEYANVFPCIYKGREIIVVAIQSNDEEIGAYARSDYGANAQVVIQQNSKKQVAITTQKRAKICLDDVMAALREKELYYKKLPVLKNVDLKSDGTLIGIPEWFYDKPAARILNGSLSAPTVVATKIPFKEIVKIVHQKICVNFSK